MKGGLERNLFYSKKKGKTLIEPLMLKRLARNMEQIPQADE
jgi:hypothetical protein